MKKLAVLIAVAACFTLTACGKTAGHDLKELKVQSLERTDDMLKAGVSFDKSYDDVKVVFHADINDDSFEGVAENSCDLGAVEPGKLYEAETSVKDAWSYNGTFKNISIGSGSLDLSPPSIADQKIKVIVKAKDKELTRSEAK